MIAFRTAQQSDLAQVLDWAAEEGWNPGLEDAAAFFAADPSGFFVALDDGTPQAAISVVNHSDSFAFLGLYIVRPPYRGRGIGYGLWQHALAHAGTRTVGLDGVPEQQANYAASGFEHAGATTRYTGFISAKADEHIRLADTDDIKALSALEAQASGIHKPAYLEAWLEQADTRTTLIADSADAAHSFCTVRRCGTGAKIGPLVAHDVDTAERLMHHAASLYPGEVSIDVPETSAPLAALCARLGLTPGFRTARMYRGPFKQAQSEIYAVTSLELG
ncbi:GNAT family N-acetyltransferase [Tateyamaria sp. SN3-11]|uniref:GNAT family N-acetyltransferase n=1 Tax=Tateyamaria sp. SN3-11 TaxID=3092147 RepID=UPI0039EC2E8F